MKWTKFSERCPDNEECKRHGAYILVLDKGWPHRPKIVAWYYSTDYRLPSEYKKDLRNQIEATYDYWCPLPELPYALQSSDENVSAQEGVPD